ncbi:MAG: M14 family metallopeptidase [Bacteroidota bacterium]
MRIYGYSLVLILIVFTSCKNAISVTDSETTTATPQGYQGQAPSPVVPTVDKPVQRQWKGTWSFERESVFFSNNFDGARLNGVASDGNNHYTIWITAENTPINVSPWYAFKVWSKEPKEITIKLSYQNSRSRYYPKLSKDGIHFKPIDSIQFKALNPGEGDFGINAAPEFVELKVQVDENPLWISAQELYSSKRVKSWVDSLSINSYIKSYEIGRSHEKRPIHLMEIAGPSSQKKAVMVITRQHPPEVTGFLAMKSFIETISGSSEQAKEFRDEFTIFVVPNVNPDGVDNGHWRHNMGGIDLNRDWQNFNQPETKSIRKFLEKKAEEGYDFVFGVDFHSTWDDIYYPLDTTVTGQKGKIVFDWIKQIENRLPQKESNVKPSDKLSPTMVSRTYFFVEHDMPAIVFELGDNTPRDFLKEKGRVAAEELMELLQHE